jgi:acyl-CoA synthetase (AMP-forming)/AMP-acid ligase II
MKKVHYRCNFMQFVRTVPAGPQCAACNPWQRSHESVSIPREAGGMNVTDAIREVARRQPDALAYTGVPEHLEVPYSHFDKTIDAFAARMLDAGLRAGQTAIVDLRIDYAIIVATLALMRIGVAAAAPTLPERLADARVTGTRTAGALREILVDRDFFAVGNAQRETPSATDAALPCIVFGTSGTTGLKRHFAVTHAMMARRFAIADEILPFPANPRVMIKAGLLTGFAFLMTLRAFRAGALAAFPRNDEVVPAMYVRRINLMCMAPSTASYFLQDLSPGVRFPALERVYLSGSFAPRQLIEQARNRLCPDVRTLYGATEVGPVACAPREALGGRPDAVGIVAQEVDVECVNDEDVPCAPGVEGIIRIRRNPGSGAYLDAPEASQLAFRGDWFYPGDTGVLTPDRVLEITGRTRDIINTGGEKRSLRVIEEGVRSMGGVADVAAYTIADALGVPQLRVAVVAGPSLDVRALAARCLEHNIVPRPTRFLTVAALPRTDFGKIALDALQDLAGEEFVVGEEQPENRNTRWALRPRTLSRCDSGSPSTRARQPGMSPIVCG